MGTLINIANIPIYINGPDFLENLTLIERRLLQPFILRRSPGHKRAKHFVINIRIIKKTRIINNQPFDPLLVDRAKARLACPIDHNVRKNFGFYLNRLFYSDENQFREFIDVLISLGETSKVIPGKEWLSILDREGRTGYVFRPRTILSMDYLGILKTLFTLITTKENGILLHASSVEDKGRGYVFVGPSNSGKSTIAKIGGFERILSDDAAVIRRVRHSYAIFSNPWWNIENVDNNTGMPNSGNSVPLKALFFIKKAKKTAMRRMSLKEVLLRLRYRDGIFNLIRFYGTSLEVKNFYIFSLALAANIPIFELRIKKGPDFKQEFQFLLRRYLDKKAYSNDLGWLR